MCLYVIQNPLDKINLGKSERPSFHCGPPPDFQGFFISFCTPPPPLSTHYYLTRLNYSIPSDLGLNGTLLRSFPLSSTLSLLCANITTARVLVSLFVFSILECKLYGSRDFGCLIVVSSALGISCNGHL